MTCDEARKRVLDDRFRGPGCASIVMADGRKYFAVGRGTKLVEQITDDGELVERLDAADVQGEVEHISWSCDELGGIYIG